MIDSRVTASNSKPSSANEKFENPKFDSKNYFSKEIIEGNMPSYNINEE